jgi:hypothetical protein
VVPRLGIKGAFGVGFADRSLALATLDTEPPAAPGAAKKRGQAEKKPARAFARHPS